MPFQVPADAQLAERLTAVLAVVYLVFNEGYAATSGDVQVRGERFKAMAERLTDEEKATVWPAIKQTIPQMSTYEVRTDRNICVFRLRRRA